MFLSFLEAKASDFSPEKDEGGKINENMVTEFVKQAMTIEETDMAKIKNRAGKRRVRKSL